MAISYVLPLDHVVEVVVTPDLSCEMVMMMNSAGEPRATAIEMFMIPPAPEAGGLFVSSQMTRNAVDGFSVPEQCAWVSWVR